MSCRKLVAYGSGQRRPVAHDDRCVVAVTADPWNVGPVRREHDLGCRPDCAVGHRQEFGYLVGCHVGWLRWIIGRCMRLRGPWPVPRCTTLSRWRTVVGRCRPMSWLQSLRVSSTEEKREPVASNRLRRSMPWLSIAWRRMPTCAGLRSAVTPSSYGKVDDERAGRIPGYYGCALGVFPRQRFEIQLDYFGRQCDQPSRRPGVRAQVFRRPRSRRGCLRSKRPPQWQSAMLRACRRARRLCHGSIHDMPMAVAAQNRRSAMAISATPAMNAPHSLRSALRSRPGV